MNTSIINFDYKGNQISFMNGKDVMVNATQLAKPYNKRPAEYLRLPDTLKLMNAITRKYGIVENQLVTTSKGGNVSDMGKSHIVENQQGTWIHRLIAIDYCQWLDIDLKLWCTEKLDELARYGFTATQPTLEQMLDDPDLVISLATQLKQERNAKAMLQAENQLKDEQLCLQSQQLKLAAPKIQYVDNVLRSVNTYTATQLAKELGFTSGEALNKKLKEMRVQYKQSGQWLLYTDYSGKGYTKTKTESFTRNDGSIGTNTYTVWTEVGRAFLHSLFKDA
ncbi:hypothetical protein F3B42_14375 [Bacteroides ovatus]|jgi:phage antirepressor YoqD-like protein|nr:hypothetical protein F3B42_14375 [Bacteroides ovatus]KAA4680768.1 hypothetical protein F3B41_15665 [Bacteroides ovatus]DAP46140.1 MAG TPA: KilA protein [Caudoviricetes sp.]